MNNTEWTEERIEALPKEDNTFDRKSSKVFAVEGRENEQFRNDLAKQLSAFANTGGGYIILGADDNGRIDGGLPLIAKGRSSTKDYLEDVIPGLTDEKIVGFRVIEIGRSGDQSQIPEGRAVFVIEVPDSEHAPHQSTRDNVYYIRVASKSRPASHRLIEDIRNRVRHPKVEVVTARIVGATYLRAYNPPQLALDLEIPVRNSSRIRATSVCLELSAPHRLTGRNIGGGTDGRIRNSGRAETTLVEITDSFYPGMELTVNVGVLMPALLHSQYDRVRGGLVLRNDPTLTVGDRAWDQAVLRVTLYADSAPAETKEFSLPEIDSNHVIENLLRTLSQ